MVQNRACHGLTMLQEGTIQNISTSSKLFYFFNAFCLQIFEICLGLRFLCLLGSYFFGWLVGFLVWLGFFLDNYVNNLHVVLKFFVCHLFLIHNFGEIRISKTSESVLLPLLHMSLFHSSSHYALLQYPFSIPLLLS